MANTVDPRTFDLFAPEEAVVYPTDTVKVYRDRASILKLGRIEAKIARTIKPDDVEALEAQKVELSEKVLKSALLVELKGIPSNVIDDISESIPAVAEGEKEDSRNATINMKVLETMIVQISNAEGAVAGHPGERTKEWFDSLPPEGRKALMDAILELSFRAMSFEAETESVDF